MLYVGQQVTLHCMFRTYRVDLAYSSTVQTRACTLAGVLDEFGGPCRHQVVTVTELRTDDAFMQAVRSRSCDGLVSGWGDGSGTLGEESAAVACSSNPRGLHQETGPYQSTSAVRTVSWVFHSRYVGLSVAVMVCGTDWLEILVSKMAYNVLMGMLNPTNSTQLSILTGGRCNILQHWSATCQGWRWRKLFPSGNGMLWNSRGDLIEMWKWRHLSSM